MPLFMDRHDTSSATSADIAAAHERDMELQSKHGVRFLTYWFDYERGATYCLVDAKNHDSVNHVHREAHGNLPTDIVEVELDTVRAFLGRTADPDAQEGLDGEMQPAIDSAFRAIMFTDLVGSTSLSTHLGDLKAFELLEQHDKMIRSVLSRTGGREVKHTGDGILSSFKSVDDCVQCAVEIQEAFSKFNELEPEVPLHVRIGINAGEPIERGGDLFGMVVQLASRVCDKAEADQIYVSGIIPTLCEGSEVKFADAGQYSLKGFMGVMQIYEVLWR